MKSFIQQIAETIGAATQKKIHVELGLCWEWGSDIAGGGGWEGGPVGQR